MQDVSCNIALASWYYFYNATGNGGPNAVYISNYCAGNGIAGTMVTGLLSHLLGGAYPRPLRISVAGRRSQRGGQLLLDRFDPRAKRSNRGHGRLIEATA